jgi:hypothetical protein
MNIINHTRLARDIPNFCACPDPAQSTIVKAVNVCYTLSCIVELLPRTAHLAPFRYSIFAEITSRVSVISPVESMKI